MGKTKSPAGDVAFLQRLTEMVELHADGNWSRFAQGAGLKQQTLHAIKQGRVPRADNLRRICESYDISADWLLLGKPPPAPQARRGAYSHDALTRGVSLDTGEIIGRIRNLADHLMVPRSRLRMAVIDNDQMAPTLTKGALFVYSTSFKLGAGLYVLKGKASAPLLCRRVVRAAQSDRYRLISDNPKYPEEHATTDALRRAAKGKVVWFETYPD